MEDACRGSNVKWRVQNMQSADPESRALTPTMRGCPLRQVRSREEKVTIPWEALIWVDSESHPSSLDQAVTHKL